MSLLSKDYSSILSILKEKIRNARLKAVFTVNAQLLAIYWEIGKTILEQQNHEGWGAKIIDNFAADLKAEFPDMKGLSIRNLKYMRAFAEAYPDLNEFQSADYQRDIIVQTPSAQLTQTDSNEFVQTYLAQLSWYHHTTLLEKIKDKETRFFYIKKTVENGWSRDTLVHQIESGLHKRQGVIQNNFNYLMAPTQSDLVQQVFKDPYHLDFLGLGDEAREKDLENALIEHISKMMLEMGDGFAFKARQFRLEAGGQEYFLDLLFYHTKLRRHIVIELKIGEFKPEYAGKMNFYLGLVDERFKDENHEPAIGLILCKTKNKIIAEYALRDTSKPIGIAEYKLHEQLPENIKGQLPTIEEIEMEIEVEVERLEKPVDKKMNHLKELLKGLKNEEAREKRSNKRTFEIFENVLLRLKDEIFDQLKNEIIPLFNDYKVAIQTGSYIHTSVDTAYKHMQEHPGEFDFGLEFNLNGFKPAGINAFNCSAQIRIYLHEFKYTISRERHIENNLVKKMYHQIPDINDFFIVVDSVKENLIDKINQQLEYIKLDQEKKEI